MGQPQGRSSRQVRTVFISDVHLGSRHSQYLALLDFLQGLKPQSLYLVGDVIDGFQITATGGTSDDLIGLPGGFLGAGQTTDVVGANSFADVTVIDFSPAVPAIGMDIYVGAPGPGDVTIEAFDGGGASVGSFTVTTTALDQPEFAGFVSPTPVAQVVITGVGDSGELLDDLAFGSTLPQATEVPTLGIAGILLLLVSIDMVFGKSSGGTSTTDDEEEEARHKADLSVFPLATPLIAGPAAMGAAVLLMADAGDDWARKGIVIGALCANLVLAFVLLMVASGIQKLLGVTGLNVISRVVGVLLAALAVQFMFDGIASSALFAALR